MTELIIIFRVFQLNAVQILELTKKEFHTLK